MIRVNNNVSLKLLDGLHPEDAVLYSDKDVHDKQQHSGRPKVCHNISPTPQA